LGRHLFQQELWPFKNWSTPVDLGYDVIDNTKVVRGRRPKRSPRRAIWNNIVRIAILGLLQEITTTIKMVKIDKKDFGVGLKL
jgi:hypothetical protein